MQFITFTTHYYMQTRLWHLPDWLLFALRAIYFSTTLVKALSPSVMSDMGLSNLSILSSIAVIRPAKVPRFSALFLTPSRIRCELCRTSFIDCCVKGTTTVEHGSGVSRAGVLAANFNPLLGVFAGVVSLRNLSAIFFILPASLSFSSSSLLSSRDSGRNVLENVFSLSRDRLFFFF